MKKTVLFLAVATIQFSIAQAQTSQQLQTAVTKLDQVNSIKDYQQFANAFLRIAKSEKTDWLPYYYAAFCNAKIGWLKEMDDPDNIELFAKTAEEEINKAESLIDTAKQKKELSEIYCIKMMLNQARVFINPQTYGSKYGATAFQYLAKAHALNRANPRALYLEGWQKFATPKMWGGDKALAKQLLEEAKQKLDAEPNETIEPHWGEIEVNDLLNRIK